MTYFRIHLDGAPNLTAEEIWPDGDGPENPTALDVARRIADDGIRSVVLDWDLLVGMCITDGKGGIVDIDEMNRVRDRSAKTA